MVRLLCWSLCLCAFVAAGTLALIPNAVAQDEENDLRRPEDEEAAKKIARNSKVWYLDFEHEHPKRIDIKLDTGDVETYWFMVYRLTNNTALERDLAIQINAVSDKGYRYHDLGYPTVAAEVRKLLDLPESIKLHLAPDLNVTAEVTAPSNPRPDREPRRFPLPTIRPNETKLCCAIFDAWDNEMDNLTIEVRGLTNSRLSADEAEEGLRKGDIDPKTDVELQGVDKPRSCRRLLRERILLLQYRRPGDEFYTVFDSVHYDGERWETRERVIATDLR